VTVLVIDGASTDGTVGIVNGFRIHRQAKSAMISARWREEREQAVRGRQLPGWQVRMLQARRFALMFAGGHFFYLARALIRRAFGIRKDLA
jgi:hypothetical protein